MPTKPASTPARQPFTLDRLLESSVWFPELDADAKARVREEMRETTLGPGAFLCRRGEQPSHWYGTIEGLLKWSIGNAEGRSATLGGLSAGSWFGEGTLLRQLPRTADVVALRPSRVALMPLDTFAWLHASQRSFDRFLLNQLNERMHWFLGNSAAHALLDTDRNVARALAGLFHPWLHPCSDPRLKLTQEEIAHLSGVSRQRCNAALQRLAADGLLEIQYGGITVVDLQGLRQLVPY